MDWAIIGVEYVEYVSKKTNKPVIGKKFHASRPIDEDKGEGYEVEAFYCSKKMSAYTCVGMGDDVKPVYNKFGVLEDLVLVKNNI